MKAARRSVLKTFDCYKLRLDRHPVAMELNERQVQEHIDQVPSDRVWVFAAPVASKWNARLSESDICNVFIRFRSTSTVPHSGGLRRKRPLAQVNQHRPIAS